MQHEIWFVERPDDGDWHRVWAAGDERVDDPTVPDDSWRSWDLIVERVRATEPDTAERRTVRSAVLEMPSLAAELTMTPVETLLRVTPWFERHECLAAATRLQHVARSVEWSTDLTAYDPQLDRPFLNCDPDRIALALATAAASLGLGPGELRAMRDAHTTAGQRRRRWPWRRR